MKCVFKKHDLQMFGLKVNKLSCGSEIKLQVCENLSWRVKG